MNEISYSPIIQKLFTYGSCRLNNQWDDYLKLGFTKEHVPELIRLATDEKMIFLDGESLEVWAPVHAWRTLGQLRAEEAIEPLIRLFPLDDDWVPTDMPNVFKMIGPKAIPPLSIFFNDSQYSIYARSVAAECLTQIGIEYPESRDTCLSILIDLLGNYKNQDRTFNGLIINNLVDLNAVEHLPLIKKAFDSNKVDLTVNGDIEELEIVLGVRKDRTTPAKNWVEEEMFDGKPIFSRLINHFDKKIGRNDPCYCGSGKKYKKCCGK